MSWLSRALKKSYQWKEKHLKPNEWKPVEDAIPGALALINPVVGAIAEGLHLARKGLEEKWNNEDLAAIAIANNWDLPPPVDIAPPPDNTVPPPQSPIPDFGIGYTPASNAGGGIPVSLFAQLGQALKQQTPAVLANAAKAAGRRGGLKSALKRRKKKRATAQASRPRRRKTTRKRMAKRLVKGSAAAKRYMASIRRKRK